VRAISRLSGCETGAPTSSSRDPRRRPTISSRARVTGGACETDARGRLSARSHGHRVGAGPIRSGRRDPAWRCMSR
jgi:hypothetical protein